LQVAAGVGSIYL